MTIYQSKELEEILKKLNPILKFTRYGFPECLYHGHVCQIKYRGQSFSIPSAYVYESKINEYTDWVEEKKWYGIRKENVESKHRCLKDIIKILVGWRAITPGQGALILTHNI